MSPWEIDWKNHCCRVPFIIPIMISMTTHQMTFNRMKIGMKSPHGMAARTSMQMELLHSIQQTMIATMMMMTVKNQFQLKIAWAIHHQMHGAWMRTNGRQTSRMTSLVQIVWTMMGGSGGNSTSNSIHPNRVRVRLKAFGQWRRNAKRIVSVALLVILTR